MLLSLRGLDGAGKSTVVAQWMGQDVSQVGPTFGFRIYTLPKPPYDLHLWDIGGQKSIRAYWRNYYEETDGLVFVIDAAAPHRLEESLAELKGLMAQDRLAGASLLIVANKQDCRGALGVGQIEECLRGMGLGGERVTIEGEKSNGSHYKIFATSALSGENVTEALQWLVMDIAARLYHHNSKSLLFTEQEPDNHSRINAL